jgi:protein NrfD
MGRTQSLRVLSVLSIQPILPIQPIPPLMVLFLFLSHLAIGIVFTLVLVSREAGVKFFRFNAGLAALILVAAFAFRPPEASATDWGRVAFGALIVLEAALVIYWATIGRALASIRPAIAGTAILAGIVALGSQAIASTTGGPPVQTMTIISFFSSALLLGGACTAMILGHWYLVIPSLQVSHLQSIVKVHMASMALRVFVVASAIFVAIVSWEPGLGPSFQSYIFSIAGIFFWQRVLFGLLGPAVLSYLTWETAKIRSTQSATGILYVDFFTVVVGEVLAKYLFLATRVAL